METTAADGKNYTTTYYSLDAIIAVGYRVSSLKATRFRQWATKILNEYIKKGFAMDDERLKQGNAVFGKDITWHTYHTTQNGLLAIDQVLTYLESDATFSRDEPRRNDNSRLTVFFQTVK